MFVPEREQSWWVECLDRVGQATPLPREDCRRLAERFVGCNLVVDVADLFWGILRRWEGEVVAGVRYRDLCDWLESPPSAASRAALLFRGGHADGGGSSAAHPWRRINRWLGIDALARLLSGGVSSPAAERARATFDSTLAEGGFVPPVCQAFAGFVRQAFEDWWDSASGLLTALLRDRIWPHHDTLTLRELAGGILAEGLHQDASLEYLVWAKNLQLDACVRRLNSGLNRPFPLGWLEELIRRLAGTQEAGQDFRWWTPSDRQHLAFLLLWVVARGQAAGLDGGKDIRLSQLYGLVVGPAPRVIPLGAPMPADVPWPAVDLASVLGECMRLHLILGQQSLPETWGGRPPFPPGWLGLMHSNTLSAWESSDDLPLDGEDCRNLTLLQLWVLAHGLSGRLGTAVGGAERTRLWEYARTCPLTVPGLALVLYEWADAELVLRTRGLPPDWRLERPVEDLFFTRLPRDFGGWSTGLSRYW